MTHRLRSELTTDYADNTDGSITEGTGRNFVESVTLTRVRTVTTSAPTIDTDDDYVRIDTTSNTVTPALPALASAGQQPYTFKWVAGANTATLDGDASEQIEGSGTYVFTTLGDAVVLRPGPTQWEIVSEFLNA